MSWSVAGVLAELRELDETARIEAKRGLGKSVRETLSAFANEPDMGGGWLVFGVIRDEQGDYIVSGVPDPDTLQGDLASLCRTAFNRVLRPEIRVEQVDGGVVVVAYIPEATATDKPVYMPATGLPKGAWRRIGSADQRLVDADLAELASLAQSTTFDRRPLPQAVRADLDEDAVAIFRRYLRDARPTSELLSLDTDTLLEAIGALVSHRGERVPTAAGVLLFGKKLALRRLFPAMRIDYIRIQGTEWSGDSLENYSTIEIREALMTGWRRTFAAIMDDLPVGFHLPPGAVQRQDQPAIPERVIREAVINALSHRSYEVHSAIQIRRFTDRVEIESPGYSLVPEEQWGSPVSRSRNPALTAVFRDLHLAEERGPGIRRMRERMAEANLAAPRFESDRAGGRFVTTFWLHHFLSDQDLAWIGQLPVEGLSSAEVRVLVHMRHHERVTNREVRELTGLGTHAVTLLFRKLMRHGVIGKHGKSVATYYTLLEHAPAVPQPGLFDDNTAQSGPSRDPVGTQSGPSRDPVGTQSGPSRDPVEAPSRHPVGTQSRHPVGAQL